MKKWLFVAVILFAGIAAALAVFVPHEAPKVGPPFIISLSSTEPLIIHIPMSNRGSGTLQVSMGIWGSPSDISHGTPTGLETSKTDAASGTTGSGPIIVRSNETSFLSPYQDYDDHYLLGEIAHQRKYPVHLGFAWRRGNSEGKGRFVIPPDKDIVVPVPSSSK
jgi:hypothetical protein